MRRKYCTDCFAFVKITRTKCACNALEELICKNGKCSFYKSKNQYTNELKRLETRRNVEGE